MDEGYSWLRLMIDSSFASRLLVDREGAVVFANRAAETLFGFSPGELVGKPVDVIFKSPKDRDLAVPRRYFPGRRMVGDDEEIKGRTKQGDELTLRVGTSRIETDAASYLSVTIFDITKYKQTELELLFRSSQLEEAKRRVSKFAYLATHDLRDRLRMIASCCDAVTTALAQGDAKAAANAGEIALDSASRAERLVGALMEYSLEASAILNLEYIHLRSEIDLIIAKLGRQGDASVKIANNVPVDLTIKADRNQFMRLVGNLIERSLAVAQKPAAPQINISAVLNKEHNRIRLAIGGRDLGKDGPSASLQALSQIPSESGLAAVKSICEQNGWTVKIETLPDHSAGFQVDIPLNRPLAAMH
jgi:PAS domain S-box-containing protein